MRPAGSTWLFVPGDRPDRFGKAAASGADEVILDLEDAVTDDRKSAARRAVTSHLRNGGTAWVRINAASTGLMGEDLDALAGVQGLRGVVVPKAEDPGVLAEVAAAVGGPAGVVALVETAIGVRQIDTIARCGSAGTLAFGSVDLAADLGAAPLSPVLTWARCELVTASRAAGITAPIDGVTVDLDDPGVLLDDARAARDLGFGGKLCIHPAQVRPVAQAFGPTVEQIAWAGAVLDAADGAGAQRVAGEMVDRPVLERARRILDSARRAPV